MRKLLFLFLASCSIALNAQYKMCGGGTATIVATSTLSNPTYSLAPGHGQPNQNDEWVVSPNVTTTYTIIATSGSSTQSTPVTVTVNPQPNAAPQVTNMNCTADTAAYNLNLTFNPGSPVPSYTLEWGGAPPNVPGGWTTGQTSGSGTLAPSIYTANITASGGCSVSVEFTILPQPSPASYSLVPLATHYSLTCNQKTININASDPVYTYTFYSTSAPPVTNTEVSVTFSSTGTWTVTGTNPNSGCTKTYTFVVATNTAVPTGTINPAFQAVNCSNPVPQTVTLTALNPQVNITHSIISNVGPTFIANNATVAYNGGPDTYTHVLINNSTGCFSTRQFTIAAASTMPTFSVSSPQNFSLGCSTKSFAVVTFSGSTQPTPGGVVHFTLLAPGASSTLPSGGLSTNNVYTITAPGTWTGVARDFVTQCDTRFSFSILQKTEPPSIDSLVIPRPILNCDVPRVILEGFSETPGASYTWAFPGGNLAGNSVTVDVNQANPTNTLIANFSLTVRDPVNFCITTTVVPMKQNLFKPIARIGSTNSITCKSATVELTNQSITGITAASGYATNSLVVGFLWQGPTPQPPKSNSTSYVAGILGIYTLTAKDLNNGCTSVTTTIVGEDKQVPILNNPVAPPPSVISCASEQATLTPIVTTATNALSYSWTAPPTSTTNPVGSRILSTNRAGTYSVLVTNTLNGCFSTTTMSVINGTLLGSIEASKSNGFAPLEVEFFNNSSYNVTSGTANAGITTIWSFGNGMTKKTDSAQTTPKTQYTQPGTYTVTAFIFRGSSCTDTAYQVINVELPSSLKIPNIFSPNGDGVNDLFFLKTSNLREITFEVYNRWGNRVYSLTSDTGNIEWDGSNQYGDPAAEGTYYYIVRAKGSDGEQYDQKGTITLVR